MRHVLGTIVVIGTSAAIAPIVRARIEPEELRREKSVAVATAVPPVDRYLESFERAKLFGGTKEMLETPELPSTECAIDVLDVVLVDGAPQFSVAAVRVRAAGAFSPVVVVQRGDEVGGARVVGVDAIVDARGFVSAGVVDLERDGARMRCAGGGAMRTVIADAPPGVERAQTFTRDELRTALERDVYIARADPVRDGGTIRGWKLSRIPGTSLARLGLANGDVVRRVNGYEIDGPKRALELLAVLQNESDFTIDFERNGKPDSLRVRIP